MADKKPLDDGLLRRALKTEDINHDPAAMARAVAAAMRVFEEEKQKNEESGRGFSGVLRQLLHRLTRKDEMMSTQKTPSFRKRMTYAVPVLAAAAVVAWVGLTQMDNPYSTREDDLGFQSMAKKEPENSSSHGGGLRLMDSASSSPAPVGVGSSLKNMIRSGMDTLAEAKSRVESSVESSMESKDAAADKIAPAGAAVAGMAPMAAPAEMVAPPPPVYVDDTSYPQQWNSNSAQFSNAVEQVFQQVQAQPVSTFSLDVDTASYSFVRKSLTTGQLPDPESVRIEEMVNYFPYSYKAPESADKPFATTLGVYPSPWNKNAKIIHIGIKAYQAPVAQRPKANLVFLIDTSGSMGPSDRLPLLKNALASFVDELREDDMVAIVTYANGSGIALPPTSARDKRRIKEALANLGAGGGTAGAAGLHSAYKLAEAAVGKDSTTRVILATDGDFNIGISDPNALQHFIEGKREKGVYLTVLGVGGDNLNDALMQRLAQYGNGTAAYLDNLTEAHRVLGEQLDHGMVPVANDVKAQIEFNPAKVAEYRLIGYETRALKREDFNNDKVDAGDVGAGQEVTALYEIVTTDARAHSVDDLRYGAKKAPETVPQGGNEYAFLKLRYKKPGDKESVLISEPIGADKETDDVTRQDSDMRFAAAVAGFGELLKGSSLVQGYGYDDVLRLAEKSLAQDPGGLRREFLSLVRAAKSAAELGGTGEGVLEDESTPQPPTPFMPWRKK